MRHRRAVLVLTAVVVATAAQLTLAWSSSTTPAGTRRDRGAVGEVDHRRPVLVAPGARARPVRSVGQVLGVTLAAALAAVGLAALWCIVRDRRTGVLAHAVVTYRRRGPPLLSS